VAIDSQLIPLGLALVALLVRRSIPIGEALWHLIAVYTLSGEALGHRLLLSDLALGRGLGGILLFKLFRFIPSFNSLIQLLQHIFVFNQYSFKTTIVFHSSVLLTILNQVTYMLYVV